MKQLAALAILGLVTAAPATARASTAPLMAAAPAVEQFASRLHVEAPVVAPVEAEPRTSEPVRLQTRTGRVVSIPMGCASVGEKYDVVIHFHGAPSTVEPAYARTGMNAVLVVVNLGVGSGKYENEFVHASALENQLGAIERTVNELCPTTTHEIDRVALSAWSAGYGAVFRILGHESAASRVDAVLLADGLHVGFAPVGFRKVNPLHIAPFTAFAESAARGEKLFAITHTQIPTPGYASTTESADFLLEASGVERTQVSENGPREGMKLTSVADRGGLHIRGFAGASPEAHCDHLYAWGDTLLSQLGERWAR